MEQEGKRNEEEMCQLPAAGLAGQMHAWYFLFE
jgi:hypothetical protein